MNLKILLAFLGGAALASGIAYLAVRPDVKPVTRTIYVQPVQPQPSEQQAHAVSATQSSSPLAPPVEQVERPIYKQPVRKEAAVPVAKPVAKTLAMAATPASPAPAPAPVSAVQPTSPPPSNPEPAGAITSASRSFPEPAPEPAKVEPAPEPAKLESAKVEPVQPHTVTLAAGTHLAVRIGENLSTHRNKQGDSFTATLAEPLTIDDFVIAERGSRCEGRVVESDPGGRVKGVARLSLELTGIHTSDGQRIRVRTEPFAKDAPTSRREDAAKVGGGAALGAIIGAVAGGGKGAGIGAAAGGAAGAGDVAMTRGKPAEISVETRVSFRVQEPVTITERLQ